MLDRLKRSPKARMRLMLALLTFNCAIACPAAFVVATAAPPSHAGGQATAQLAPEQQAHALKFWGGLGAGLAIGLSGLGTALAQARIGAAGVGAIVENPKRIGQVIILIAIPETVVILGFVIAYLILR